MRRNRISLVRAARALFGPAAVALPATYWVVEAAERSSRTPFGRDQGIFQYVAWAIAQGERAYRDVRDVNGPLTYLVHLVFLKLGGADEHRFRVLDLVVNAIAFGAVGVLVARMASRRPRFADHAGWAAAACVVLGEEYLAFNYWDVAQRESFFDWLVLPALALLPAARSPRSFAVCGALGVAACFGKPTYALFVLAMLVAIREGRRAFAIGGAAVLGVGTALLAIFADLGSYLRISFVDVPAMYRFIWPRSVADILSETWYATQAAIGLGLGVAIAGLVFRRQMPRALLAIAVAPTCGVLSVIAQSKSFPYHWHPVVACVGLQGLVLCAWLWRRLGNAPRCRPLARLAPVVASAAFALHIAGGAIESPFVKDTWLVDHARTPDDRRTKDYFDHFPEPDFFPFDLREAAAFLRAHTKDGDRVQTYGMDAYVLFLAGRLSATPYIYAYDLNVDAALRGGGGARPTEPQRERIRAMQREHERDLLARLERSPPAAFVFLDKAPLTTDSDAKRDFDAHCALASAWVNGRYREAARFGSAQIWLRNEL